MKNRNPFLVLLFSIITIGLYDIYLYVSTKNEMNQKGAQIPTAWLLIIPFVAWYWLWKYAEGVEQVTNNEFSQVVSFLLIFFLGGIGQTVLQTGFNKVGASAPSAAPLPGNQPVGQTTMVPASPPVNPQVSTSPDQFNPPTLPPTPPEAPLSPESTAQPPNNNPFPPSNPPLVQ